MRLSLARHSTGATVSPTGQERRQAPRGGDGAQAGRGVIRRKSLTVVTCMARMSFHTGSRPEVSLQDLGSLLTARDREERSPWA